MRVKKRAEIKRDWEGREKYGRYGVEGLVGQREWKSWLERWRWKREREMSCVARVETEKRGQCEERAMEWRKGL